MSVKLEVTAQLRNDAGKGASRRLRRAGMVPGILYGAAKEPANIALNHNELIKHLEHEAFYSSILNVKLDGHEERAVLKDLQRHPSKPFILHCDLLRISDTDKIKVHVPLHFVGENVAPGVKAGGAVSHHVTEVEISCLPKDLPEFIEIDVSAMEVGDAVSLSGITLPEGVEIPILAQGSQYDVPVVSLHSGHVGYDEEVEDELLEAGPEEGAEEAT